MMLVEDVKRELVQRCLRERKKAYSPYSGFCVGAALLCKNGKIYTGANIENVSYGASNCAERTAIFKAVSNGESDFSAIAICASGVGEEVLDFCPPCGICRQVMSEFCEPDFKIILIGRDNKIKEYTLEDILPISFNNGRLGRNKW